jgi:excisionase family DNA binding protein
VNHCKCDDDGLRQSESNETLTTCASAANSTRPSLFFDNQLINYEQAARYLSVSVPYLRKLKARGKIPFVPMGRGVRFRVKSLNEWAEKREIK